MTSRLVSTVLAMTSMLGLVACGSDSAAPAASSTMALQSDVAARTGASAGVHNLELAELLERHWAWFLAEHPTWATMFGEHRFDDRIEDISAYHRAVQRHRERAFLEEAQELRMRIGNELDASDALTLDELVGQLDTSAGAADACRLDEWNVAASSNPFSKWNILPQIQSSRTFAEAKNLLRRYRAIPGWIDTNIDNLARGARAGMVGNATSMNIALQMVDGQLAKPDADWALSGPKKAAHPDWSEAERRLFDREITILVARIRTAATRWRDFVATKLLPNARPDDRGGLRDVPGGAACYSALIHSQTSLPLTADELHDRGTSETARINEEMGTLGEKLFGTRDLLTILQHLRSDPAMFFQTEDEIEAKAVQNLALAKSKISNYFGVLPKADCVVRRIPDYEAPYTTRAYYWAPNPDGSKPGEYFVNTYQPTTRPRYEAEVLAFHESIPGHHLQIAISQELPALPSFRMFLGFTSYVEGWALYTERLANEMGLYTADLDRMGMLSFDAWRSSRLVVDTGLHAKGWSREQAVQYLLAHTALPENDIRNEVDRYINDPAQALAYKVGQGTILALREEAKAKLGSRFDIKGFHDTVLGVGAVSMPDLEKVVRDWIARPANEPSRALLDHRL
ncbi:DUF885 domain-containing protein [Pendulispora brunnea]|uniref:DUF885 domain-containing protein n=1 Tax=Pendulispora brunnea TaxID=2905690 RepID=A0ABZ2KHB7_9BACT